MNADSASCARAARTVLRKLDYSEIDAAGAYVMHSTGLLVRVLPEAVAHGRSPLVSLTGQTPVWVTRISEDPWLPLNVARGIAANHDLAVDF